MELLKFILYHYLSSQDVANNFFFFYVDMLTPPLLHIWSTCEFLLYVNMLTPSYSSRYLLLRYDDIVIGVSFFSNIRCQDVGEELIHTLNSIYMITLGRVMKILPYCSFNLHYVCFHHREITQMQFLATMRFFALIPWQLMGLSIGATLTKRLVELVRQFRTTYMQYLSGQLWLKLMQTWLQHTRIGMLICSFCCCYSYCC